MQDFTEENEPLKRCPFCGGEALIDNQYGSVRNFYAIQCGSCLNATMYHTDLESAVKAWNRRYDADERLIAHATEMYELLRSVLNADNDNLDPDLIGDIMYCLKEIDGRW